jgi:mitochondrial fission protein ELM1
LPTGTPVIWVLEGARAGDNAQVRELAARLPAVTEVKNLRYNRLYRRANWLLGARLISVESGAETLVEPWPDLVIGIGRRSVPVARWIQRQSGGRTRLVQMGRPRARSDIFDLVITTPQYGLPPAPNVIELVLPFVPNQIAPALELDFWRKEFANLPEPRIAVLVGGPSGPVQMRVAEIRDLFRGVEVLGRRLRGSLIIVSSPRTPKEAFEEAAMSQGEAFRVFSWGTDKENPYRSLLQIADRFVVTSDSVSMLAEAVRTGKPVDVFRLPVERRYRMPIDRWPFSELVKHGFLETKRSVDSFVSRLISNRHVGTLGAEDFVRIAVPDDEDRIVERVRALLTSQ